MKQRYMRLFIAALTIMGGLSIQKMYAETKYGNFGSSNASKISAVLSTGRPNTDKAICYLYNLGDQKMMNAGCEWGTRASMFTDVGAKIWFEQSTTSGLYWIHTESTTSGVGSYLGWHPCSDNGNTTGLFLDREPQTNPTDYLNTKGKIDLSSVQCYWHIEQNTDMQSVIYCTLGTNTEIRYYLEASKKATGDNKYDSVKFVSYTTNFPTAGGANLYAQWYIITQTAMKALFKLLPSALASPADATFYLYDPDFSRHNKNEDQWKFDGLSSQKDGVGYRFGIDKGTDQTDAAYYCGEIRKADGKMYQTVTIDKDGWYTLQCYGFYKKGSNADAKASLYAIAKDEDGNDIKMTNELNNIAYSDEDEPSSLLAAGKAFAQSKFSNGTMFFPVYLKKGTAQIELGIETSGTPEWVAFDDIQLKYNGDGAVLILDERYNRTVMGYVNSSYELSVDKYKRTNLFLHREFTQNQWSTIVLPVSIPKQYFLQTFGTGTKLARIYGLNDKNVLKFQLIDPYKEMAQTGTYLEANVPYLIKTVKAPTTAPTDITCKVHDKNNKSTTSYIYTLAKGDTYFSIPYVSLEGEISQNVQQDNLAPANSSMLIYAKGKYYCDDESTRFYESSYILSNNQLRFVTSGTSLMMKGYRCWFEVQKKSTNAKELQIDVEDADGNVYATLASTSTGLVETTADVTSTGNQKVYNINGQLVNTSGSLEGLPKGLYIMNGKKYVVQ